MNNITKVLISASLLFQYACNNGDPSTRTSSTEPIKIENQGVNIEYTDSKIGDTVLLFIHGWAIDQSYWANQIAFFSKKYRVVTLDLPGFGKSGKNRNSWTVEDYGKDLSALLTKLDLKNVILIGHSMSGAIAVETALTNPTRVLGVVGVDNFKKYGVVETPESKAETAAVFKAMKSNFKAVVGEYLNKYLFSPSTDSLVRMRVLNDMTSADSIIAVECLEKNDQYPLDEKLKSWKKPIFAINSDLRPTDTASFRNHNIDYVLFNIGPTGHYPMLEKPNEFNALIQQVMDKIGK